MKKTVKRPDFDKDGFITKDGKTTLRAILKQFDAPLKALNAFSGDGDGIKLEIGYLRENYL